MRSVHDTLDSGMYVPSSKEREETNIKLKSLEKR